MKDLDLSRRGEDGFCAERMPFYAALYPVLREAARQKGYALAIHGSLTKDLDLLAVPWVDDAASEEVLVVAIVEACGGMAIAGGRFVDGALISAPPRSQKPHGRVAWTIQLGGDGGYIDLSVMPRAVR